MTRVCLCIHFAGQSAPTPDDVQRSVREAADDREAVRTVQPPPACPREPLHHQPHLPLPIHQKQNPSMTIRGTPGLVGHFDPRNKQNCTRAYFSGGLVRWIRLDLKTVVCLPAMRLHQLDVCSPNAIS